MMKYCTQCGAENPKSALFCMRCGASINYSVDEQKSDARSDAHPDANASTVAPETVKDAPKVVKEAPTSVAPSTSVEARTVGAERMDAVENVEYAVNLTYDETAVCITPPAERAVTPSRESGAKREAQIDEKIEETPVGFWDCVGNCLNKYSSVEGRANRREYFYWGLFVLLANVALAILCAVSEEWVAVIALFNLATICPSVCVAIRRLHDLDKGWTWMLLGLIPYLGAAILGCMLLFSPGKPERNQYGLQPVG
ncbi:MAG: DUF805 domain-containing protein [Thermoguttaceae bacterium]|nr:DUF805 domain-containing protein [Thermoguttaceae bacterium]